MNKFKSINPSNGKVLGEVEISTKKEILGKIDKAQKAKTLWKNFSISERIKILRTIPTYLANEKEELAQMASSEMGMPITLTRSDVDDSIHYFNWYLDNAEKYLSSEVVYEDDKVTHTVYREPIGVSANITPWNFPLSNFVWSVGQTMVSGNTVVYKTSEEVPLSGKLIEQVVKNSNLPEGVFSEIYGDGEVGKILVNGNVDLICFTGSTTVGKYLYKVASEKFIRVFLELGGSAPGVVFEDANIDRILETVFANRFLFSGQVCDGLKRLIVHEDIKEEMISKLVKKLENTVVGNAMEEKTEIGPMVSQKQLLTLEKQVEESVKKGANVETGAKKLSVNGGYFYKPTVLTNITKDMPVWNEEVFGPVLPVMTFKTEDEAIELANNTKYGLGGYVFTEDKLKGNRVARKIETGMVQINNAGYVKPTSPFGGYKNSGLGREHGKYGFHEMTQIKVVAEEK